MPRQLLIIIFLLLIGCSNTNVLRKVDISIEERLEVMEYIAPRREIRRVQKMPVECQIAYYRNFWEKWGRQAERAFMTRVAEAIVFFNEEGVPGWKTDRGKTHIALGQPDLIDIQKGRRTQKYNMFKRDFTTFLYWYYTDISDTDNRIMFIDEMGFGKRYKFVNENDLRDLVMKALAKRK